MVYTACGGTGSGLSRLLLERRRQEAPIQLHDLGFLADSDGRCWAVQSRARMAIPQCYFTTMHSHAQVPQLGANIATVKTVGRVAGSAAEQGAPPMVGLPPTQCVLLGKTTPSQ